MGKDVIAQLGSLTARIACEKQAGLTTIFGRMLGRGLGRTGPGLGRAAAKPAKALGRGLWKVKDDLALGLGGLGAYQAGKNYFDYGGGADPATRAGSNESAYNELAQSLQAQINAANKIGDFATAQRLNQQLVSGNFSNRTWYNPLTWLSASPWHRSGAYHQKQHAASPGQQPVDPAYADELTKYIQGGNLMPGQQEALQQQLLAVRQRLDTQRGRQQVVNNMTPGAAYTASRAQYSALNPYDHRSSGNPWDQMPGGPAFGR